MALNLNWWGFLSLGVFVQAVGFKKSNLQCLAIVVTKSAQRIPVGGDILRRPPLNLI
jgi:hypothetical protein